MSPDYALNARSVEAQYQRLWKPSLLPQGRPWPSL